MYSQAKTDKVVTLAQITDYNAKLIRTQVLIMNCG
jgi:hypothetical protein